MLVLGNAGVLAPGKLRWLRALGWMVALMAVVIAALNLVGYGSVELIVLSTGEHFASRADVPQSYKLIGIIVAVVAALGAYCVAVLYGERRSVPELALRQLVPEWITGCAIGGAMMAAIIGIMWLLGWVSLSAQPVTSAARALRDSIQSGVIEELLIRLIIFRMLWRAFGVWPALIVAGSFFGIIHFANPGGTVLGSVAIIAGEGVGMGLYMLTGRVWAPIGTHMAWNFTQGWIFGAAVSGYNVIAGGPLRMGAAPGVGDALTGGSFGPESSVSALIISLIGSAAILGLAWRRGCFTAADEAAG